MKTILIILLITSATGTSLAVDKQQRKDKRKEQHELKVSFRHKLDNRSRAQKRKDRNILLLMALGGFLVLKQIQE